MILECKVPEPIKLNCWKHHRLFIKEQLSGKDKIKTKVELRKILLQIGDSQMDLYLGNLSPKHISVYIVNELKKMEAFRNQSFTKWLLENKKHFKTITLPDGSVWVLRKGNSQKRYIHIHPGRYSPLTLRVRAVTLKVAIAVVKNLGIERSKKLFIENVNSIRKEMLDLPPLKIISRYSGPGEIILTLCG